MGYACVVNGEWVCGQVGEFVRGLLRALWAARGEDAEAAALWVEAPPGGPGAAPRPLVCFVDACVYTRNRAMRLLGSAKYARRARARPGVCVRVFWG